MVMIRGKVEGQLAYVLHSYPYRETSLIVEAFTREHGRVALVARGARRPRSAIRGLLLGFQPLILDWSGKGEIFTLLKAEWQGGLPLLSGTALFCGYYMNELIMQLLPREDAHENLFDHYGEMLYRLACCGTGKVPEADLRWFEKCLLQELGYGLLLDQTGNGEPIEPERFYLYEIEHGPVAIDQIHQVSPLIIQGSHLLDLAHDQFADIRSQQAAKNLMRALLNHYLGDVELKTRRIFKELHDL